MLETSGVIEKCDHHDKIEKQAGAELCQAQVS